MILIADSGATKSDWSFIDNKGKVESFSTAGLSPLFWTSKEIADEISLKFPKRVQSLIIEDKSRIYFYGTSCSSAKRIKKVKDALKKVFPKSKAIVNNDMLGSARALFGTGSGIACILGTGSNSCYYDGKEIIETIGGLSYILGDEGSGAHIGLEVLKAFLNNELPKDIKKVFSRKYNLSKDKIIFSLYTKKNPNRFLASFAKFALAHIDNLFLRKLVKDCMTKFFEKTICKYNTLYHNLPVGFVGSIAFHFKDILEEVAYEKNVKIIKIMSNPIGNLVTFHLNNN